MDPRPPQPSPPSDAPRCISAGGSGITGAAAYLRASLPPAWQVEDHFDPHGELSLIVLPADDDPALPTFLLHHRMQTPHVAMILNDTWGAEQAFTQWPDAAAAIVAMALASRPAFVPSSSQPGAGATRAAA